MRALACLLLLPLLVAASSPNLAPTTPANALNAANLAANERDWPYHVALVERWQPPGGGQPLARGTRGVLIRITSDGAALIDFGRDGRQLVPLAASDVLANANRIRAGEFEKSIPNFALALGPRLASPLATPPRPVPLDTVAASRGFLCVFADPEAPGFEALAHQLAPFAQREGVMTILLPQGAHADASVAARLRSLAWPVAFVPDGLAEAYTRTLRSGPATLPALMLVSNEGRLLYESSWRPELEPALRAALDASFAPVSAAQP